MALIDDQQLHKGARTLKNGLAKTPGVSMDRRRRRFPRYRTDFQVTVIGLLENNYKRSVGQSKDISAAGLRVLLAEDLPMGEVLSLSFELQPSTPAWQVRAVVRHRRGYHYGLEFLSLTGEQSQSLANFMATLERAD